MEPESHLSFGRLVVGKALSGTKRAFESLLRDVVIGVLSAAFGFGAYWRIFGLPEAMSETLSFILFGFGPLGFIVTAVFFWNLWLAPAELAYQAALARGEVIAVASAIPAAKHKEINWAPWRKMPTYTIMQFAKVLAQDDPASGTQSTEASAFRQLLWIAANNQTLGYKLRTLRSGYDGRPYTEELCVNSEISRAEAISWAKRQDFDVEHIE